MNDDGSGLEQCSELIEMIRKISYRCFCSCRLKEEGCESDYRKSLLDQFREDLIQTLALDIASKRNGSLYRYRADSLYEIREHLIAMECPASPSRPVREG